MSYKQHPPYAVQVELTEGCSLHCHFCGIQGIREKSGNFKYLTPTTAARIADQIAEHGWNSRIEFAMHGEPSMNPWMVDIVHAFRTALPRASIMLTSNGTGFLKEGVIDDAFMAGLNVLALDDYKHANIVPRVLDRYKGIVPIYDYPKISYANPHTRRPPNERLIVRVQDITEASHGTHAKLNNHCGCAFPAKHVDKRCAKPFRELAFRWDGNVAICCNDWRGVFKIGNINDMSLEAIWHHPRFVAARKLLLDGQRAFAPCNVCDAISYRVGLLPDPAGVEVMDAVTDEDMQHLHEAVDGKSFTLPVLRNYERH